jgi:hypothetical protein
MPPHPRVFVAFANQPLTVRTSARECSGYATCLEGVAGAPLLRQTLITQASVRYSSIRRREFHSTDGVALCGKADIGPSMPHVAARGPQQGATAVEAEDPCVRIRGEHGAANIVALPSQVPPCIM